MTKSKMIEDYILELINNDDLNTGDKLPTERQLCEHFSVSKMTVHKVINKLSSLGYIRSIRGKGIFVDKKVMDKEITKLTSFTEDLMQSNLLPETKLISFQTTSSVDNIIKNNLKLDDNDLVHVIKRLRLSNDEPFAFDIAYLNSKVVNLIDESKLNGSLYKYLEEEKELQIDYAKQKISVGYASGEIANHLQIKKDTPVLFISHVTYDKYGNIFEYVTTYYRADKYTFEAISYR